MLRVQVFDTIQPTIRLWEHMLDEHNNNGHGDMFTSEEIIKYFGGRTDMANAAMNMLSSINLIDGHERNGEVWVKIKR